MRVITWSGMFPLKVIVGRMNLQVLEIASGGDLMQACMKSRYEFVNLFSNRIRVPSYYHKTS